MMFAMFPNVAVGCTRRKLCLQVAYFEAPCIRPTTSLKHIENCSVMKNISVILISSMMVIVRLIVMCFHA